MPLIFTLWRQRQAYEFEASQGYVEKTRLKKKKNQTKKQESGLEKCLQV